MQINEKAQDGRGLIVTPRLLLDESNASKSNQKDPTGSGQNWNGSHAGPIPGVMIGYQGHMPRNNQMGPEEIRFNRKLFEKIS